MKQICQLYVPAFYRSYGKKEALKTIYRLLPTFRKVFSGIYLIALWRGGGADNGFDVVEYSVEPEFGTEKELEAIIERAHELNMTVGVDVIPNHVSDDNILAKNCLKGVKGYEDCLYVVTREEARRLTDAGVPSFFDEFPYSDFGDDKCVRSTFAHHRQLNLNWQSPKVQEYFATLFRRLKKIGIDFARVDCGPLLLEDVSKASKTNQFACMRPKASIEAVRKVAGDMTLFFEWFDMSTIDLFNDMPGCYALDCSFVMTGKQPTDWVRHPKLVPLLGGHDQMTAADRGIDIDAALEKMEAFEYGFSDMPTLVGWKTDPAILPTDKKFDADLKNPNQRYRGRREAEGYTTQFLHTFNH